MDEIEFYKEEVRIFDSLVELRTRIRCQEELYLFTLERHRTYGDMNKGKTMPSLHEGISEDGEISETLFNFYLEKQYHEYSKYLAECMDDTEAELQKLYKEYNDLWAKEDK